MKEEDYDKISNVLPLGDIVDRLISKLNLDIQEAVNQAENGSSLGMAVAIGKCSDAISELSSAWLSIRK